VQPEFFKLEYKKFTEISSKCFEANMNGEGVSNITLKSYIIKREKRRSWPDTQFTLPYRIRDIATVARR